MKSVKKIISLICTALFSLSLSACEDGFTISPTYDGGILIKPQFSSPPKIKSFDFYPKSTLKKDDVITFTVDASTKTREPLQYTWKCSKGTLLTNSGSTVSWKPEKQDGSFETGASTITVTVSDGKYTVDANANVIIDSKGAISNNINSSYNIINDTSIKNSNKPSTYYNEYNSDSTYYNSSNNKSQTSFSYSYSYSYYDESYNKKQKTSYVEDNNSCSYDVTNEDSYSGSYSSYSNKSNNNNFLFRETFETGYLDDDWNTSYRGSSSNQYLTWKKINVNGNKVAVLTGPTNKVLANTCSSEALLTTQSIDLSSAKLPRLSFYAKNDANPTTAVKLNIYWSHEGNTPKSMNVSFIPDKNWKKIDVDLKNILRDQGADVGLLSIGASICNNKNEFTGPMIDNIIIYDADY